MAANLQEGDPASSRPLRSGKRRKPSPQGATMKRRALLATTALAALAVPAHVSAASSVDRSHEQFSDTFPSNYCDIPGTSVFRLVGNFTDYSDGTFKNLLSVTETFTATASQKSIVIRTAEQFSRRSTPIDNGDGTITFVVTFNGLFEQLRITNGPVLSLDAGTVTLANTFAVDADGNFTYLSTKIVGLGGPHPEILSDGSLFCDVVVPALT
jgi:hypothetical protein